MIQAIPQHALPGFITSYSVEERRQAHALWKKYSAFPSLVDLKNYSYDIKTMRYFDERQQRFIPARQITKDALRFAMGIRDEQRTLAQKAAQQQISEQEWYDESTRLMKLSYRASIDVARGEKDNDNNELLLLLLLVYFLRFNNLAQEINTGSVVLSKTLLEGLVFRKTINRAFINRAGMYGLNNKAVYENYRLEQAKRFGFAECRRIPGPSEHCNNSERPGCDELIAKGWMSVSQMTPLGQCTCLSNCQCSLEFRGRIFPIELAPVIAVGLRNNQASFVDVYDNFGKLLFRYAPTQNKIEIKHKWHKSPVLVDLHKYK